MKVPCLFSILIIVAVFLSKPINAQTAPGQSQQSGQWLAGAHIWHVSNPIKDADSNTLPLPFLAYYGEHVFFEMNRFAYFLTKQEHYRIGLVGNIRLMGFDEDDSPILEDMQSRDNSLEVGANITIFSPLGQAEIQALTDISDAHNGEIISLKYSKSVKINNTMVKPSLIARWGSKDFMRYYYGVSPDEARTNRNSYKPDASLVWIANLNVTHPLTRQWSISSNLTYQALSSNHTDSPIIDDDYIVNAFIGLVYAF